MNAFFSAFFFSQLFLSPLPLQRLVLQHARFAAAGALRQRDASQATVGNAVFVFLGSIVVVVTFKYMFNLKKHTHTHTLCIRSASFPTTASTLCPHKPLNEPQRCETCKKHDRATPSPLNCDSE